MSPASPMPASSSIFSSSPRSVAVSGFPWRRRCRHDVVLMGLQELPRLLLEAGEVDFAELRQFVLDAFADLVGKVRVDDGLRALFDVLDEVAQAQPHQLQNRARSRLPTMRRSGSPRSAPPAARWPGCRSGPPGRRRSRAAACAGRRSVFEPFSSASSSENIRRSKRLASSRRGASEGSGATFDQLFALLVVDRVHASAAGILDGRRCGGRRSCRGQPATVPNVRRRSDSPRSAAVAPAASNALRRSPKPGRACVQRRTRSTAP